MGADTAWILSARRALGAALRVLAFLLIALAFGAFPGTAPAAVDYVYDELGRLKAVVAPNGERAEYDYDAAGNITAIRRVAGAVLTISEFSPNVGTGGTAVTILGGGFSTTPASNTVRFNGTAATVSSASATQLQVSAPAGGTSGPISVTVGASTATSSEGFTYTSGAVGPPSITSFTPNNGVAGTSVTISGTNFDPAPGTTKVEFNGNLLALISSLSATQIGATVPINAGSGPLTVVTPRGVAVSAEDFIIPPSGYTYADIVSRIRLTVGGAAGALNVSPTYKHGMALFSGSAGQYLTIQFTGVSTSPAAQTVSVRLFDPNNQQVYYNTFSATVATVHLPRLAKTGTYTLIFSPGSATASFGLALSQDATLVSNGPGVPASTAAAAQKARVVFEGTAGQNLGLASSGLSITPGSVTWLTLSVVKPDGNTLAYNEYCNPTYPGGGCSLTLTNLPVTGTYSVHLSPPYTATSIATTLTLSNDVPGTLGADTPFPVTIGRAGQNARLSFAGTAGQQLGLGLSSIAISPSTTGGMVTINKPDGSYLASTSFTNATLAALDVPALPVAGTYSVLIDPSYAATGSMTVSLSSDAGGALAIDGAPVNVNLTQVGQQARLTFSGTAGQNLGLGMTGLSLTPASQTLVTVYVYRPDGAQLTYTYCYTSSPGGGCHLNLSNLPLTGTYNVVVVRSYITTAAAMTVTLSNDATAPLVSGTPYAASIVRAGQNGRYTFSGTAGQQLGLGLSSVALSPTGAGGSAYVYRPEGAQIASVSLSNGNNSVMDLPALPSTGTYTVLIDPAYAATASVTVALSSDSGGALAIDGSPVSVNLNQIGQNARLTFSGTAGQNLGLGLSALSLTPASPNSVTLYVYKPDGVLLTYTYCYTSYPGAGCNLNLSHLPATGTYSVVVVPSSLTTASSMTFTLSSDIATSLTIDTPYAATIARAGQNGRYTFSGTAGQQLGLGLSNVSILPTGAGGGVTINKPDGTYFASASFANGSNTALDLPALPASGSYTVFIDPGYAATASMTVSLSADAGGSLPVDGSSMAATTAHVGQTFRFSFSATAGQNLGLGLTGLSLTPANPNFVTLYAYKPDGSQLTGATYCYTSNPEAGCGFNLSNLPGTGTYHAVVYPLSTATGASVTATVSTDLTGTLTTGGAAVSVATTRAGQNARYTFSGTSGHLLRLNLSGLGTAPSAQTVSFVILKPDGTALGGASTATASYSYDIPTLPSTGTYTVFVDPPYAATTTLNMSISTR